MGLLMLGRLKYTHLSLVPHPSSFEVKSLLGRKSWLAPECKRPFGNLGMHGKIILKCIKKEKDGRVDWIHLA